MFKYLFKVLYSIDRIQFSSYIKKKLCKKKKLQSYILFGV